MAEPDVFEVIEAIVAAGLEPDPTWHVDEAYARPPTYTPSVLYLYPADENQRGFESGSGVRQDFRLWLEFVVDDQGERVAEVRDPAVTAALRAKAKGYAQWVRTHQASADWSHLAVAYIDWQGLSGLETRGVRMRLEGYTLWN